MSKAEAAEIIERALSARTPDDALGVQNLIERRVGASYQRPLGDRWSNRSHLTRVGNTDHKLLELVTNSQDAVLELFALQRFSDPGDVPFLTPHEASNDLFAGMAWKDVAELVDIQLHAAGGLPRKLGRLTPTFRDYGCGMTPGYIPQSIFYLGSRHKGKAPWQQGAYGLGGASTFAHARAVVLVSRRHPDLLSPGDEDRLAVAVCLWEEFEKGSGLYYLTTSDWADGQNLNAEPWSSPASVFPDFEPGTYIALIAYEPDRIHNAAWGGEWSFERMLNTRLFHPVMPVHVENHISEKAHPQNYRGLRRQFEENPRPDRKEVAEAWPFLLDGTTYHLPVSAYYFEAGPRADVGGKRNFVNPEHALMFTSNGQCHEHWEPRELRHRTKLNHIYDRLLVVVELDELPIKARMQLFPLERQGFIDSEDTRRLKRQVVEALDDWDELEEFDHDVLRKVLSGDRNGRPTINIARQIGRALKFRGGFTLVGAHGANGNKRKRKKLAKAVLYADPTTIEGDGAITVERGATRITRFHINARDEFMASRRGNLQVASSHPDIGEREITVGVLHNGFIRVVIAVPEGAALGQHELTAAVRGWQRSTGGVGPDLVWCTDLTVIEPVPEEERRKRARRGAEDSAPTDEGELIGLLWRDSDAFEDWHPGVPGHVDNETEARLLADEHADYKELAKLGDAKIPTIFLNRDYTPLKKYESARARELNERGIDEARDRYAVGTGLGLLLLDRDLAKTTREPVPPEVELAAKQAAAQATLVMMPHYDRLAKEAGVEE